jgi:hypothetical protein
MKKKFDIRDFYYNPKLYRGNRTQPAQGEKQVFIPFWFKAILAFVIGFWLHSFFK